MPRLGDSLTSGSGATLSGLGRDAARLPRGVAQLGRALRSGRRGPRFKSAHPDHTSRLSGRPERDAPRGVSARRVSMWHSDRPAPPRRLRSARSCAAARSVVTPHARRCASRSEPRMWLSFPAAACASVTAGRAAADARGVGDRRAAARQAVAGRRAQGVAAPAASPRETAPGTWTRPPEGDRARPTAVALVRRVSVLDADA